METSIPGCKTGSLLEQRCVHDGRDLDAVRSWIDRDTIRRRRDFSGPTEDQAAIARRYAEPVGTLRQQLDKVHRRDAITRAEVEQMIARAVEGVRAELLGAIKALAQRLQGDNP
jgi:hypothetical protein